ncbi:UDP-N-acetylglucosamine transferase subunit ALG13 [Neobacillus niacini]|uniref:PssE/Cps14G family polysaccharide biosynthesis glycosyltransferase n=1 Tax=Neobacillus niacini TaxID=86668 RepID=UPI002857E4C8|nr:PssE/Cps14G family polysaccharide biosynthesis glycosyltransferase [Neobacillus niacini]MDR7078852.1 UDP-N-acetylglucosamine transferase subunit ALG13 [Neobacillus niacini]
MIFVTVGTQKFPFDRLFKELDLLVSEGIIQEEIIAQIGYTNYKPNHYKTFKFLSEAEIERYINSAQVIITHAGTSSIITCMKKKKKTLVVPRLSKYHEHVDDHQLEIAGLFEAKNAVELVRDIKQLKEKLKIIKEKDYDYLTFNNEELLNSISEYISTI